VVETVAAEAVLAVAEETVVAAADLEVEEAVEILAVLKCIRLHATNAETSAKCHSNHPEISQFYAAIVLKAAETTEVIETTEADEILKEMIVGEEMTVVIDKCLKQPAVNVEISVKFLLNHQPINRFSVMIVLAEKEKNPVTKAMNN
jgi:hypothetical protein